MARSADAAAREAMIAELKALITLRAYETQEMLEEAVDTLLWSEHDRRQTEPGADQLELARAHPK